MLIYTLRTDFLYVNAIQQTPKTSRLCSLVSHKTCSIASPFVRLWVKAVFCEGILLLLCQVPCILLRPLYIESLMHVTHWSRVKHICVSKMCLNWIRWWLVVWSGPSHHLDECGFFLSIRPYGTYFNGVFISNSKFPLKKMLLKLSFGESKSHLSASMY